MVGKGNSVGLVFSTEVFEELDELLKCGLIVNGKSFTCNRKLVVCDAPARAVVKCMKQFSGYFGYDKCSHKGVYCGRITFPECNAQPRNNDSFRTV